MMWKRVLGRCFFFFTSRRRHTRCSRDWSSDVCSSDLLRYEKLSNFDPDATIIEKMTIVELIDGTRHEGIVPIDRPREYSRISDVLNDKIGRASCRERV